MITTKRLAEIAAIAYDDINTSDIPEANEAWFKRGRLVLPEIAEARAGSDDESQPTE